MISLPGSGTVLWPDGGTDFRHFGLKNSVFNRPEGGSVSWVDLVSANAGSSGFVSGIQYRSRAKGYVGRGIRRGFLPG